jgi:copper oxidase (laccase) domain-containing protein
VTATPGCALVVRTADCAPVVLAGDRSVAVLHLGWRGLQAALVARAVESMAALGDVPRQAHLGPCIRPGCYEFKGPELDDLATRFGEGVRGVTTAGTPALDLPATVRAALAEAGVTALEDTSGCTACDQRWFSHRARGESQRFATVAWIEAP